MKEYLIVVDQSTSSSKVFLMDSEGNICGRKNYPHKQYYPRPGFVEQDAEEIFQNVERGIREIALNGEAGLSEIRGIAVTNQTGAFVLWDKETGKPVCNIVGWQCGRGHSVVEKLTDEEMRFFKERTGSEPSAFYPASKLRWVFEHDSGLHERAKAGEVLFGTIDSWLVWRLTKGKVHATDFGNACLTQLFNIFRQKWDEDILRMLEVPECILPEPLESDGEFGNAEIWGLPEIPICAVIGDSNGALFGQCGFESGKIKITYGTGVSVLVNMGKQPLKAKNGLLPAISWKRNGEAYYVLEGTAVCAGASVNWLMEELEILQSAEESEKLAGNVDSTEGVYFVSAFNGLGTPHWDENAKACILGMKGGTGKAHIVRAALEGIAYQVRDILHAVYGEKLPSGVLLADGGMTANSWLMQFQADIVGMTVVRNKMEDSSATGAAYIAGLKLGIWKNIDEIKALAKEKEYYEPKMEKEKAEELYRGWLKAVEKART